MEYKVFKIKKVGGQSTGANFPQYEATVQGVPNWFERHIMRKETVYMNYIGYRFLWYNTQTGEGPLVGQYVIAEILGAAWWRSENTEILIGDMYADL